MVELRWNRINGRYEDTIASETPAHWQERG
jgi:hypothetical protein